MKGVAALLALALLGASASALKTNVASSLKFDTEAAKDRPVTKVINLLKDMLKQLEKEAAEDEEIYDKMACWCETNERIKTKEIKDGEARINALSVKIEELTALSARLATEIENLEKEVKEDQDALDKATAIREKQLAEFNEEEKDLLESISALKAAVTVLGKHHGGASLLQMPKTHLLGVAATLQHEMQKHEKLLVGVLGHHDRRAVAAFIQAPEDFFDAEPTFKQSYAPQSGAIFGILTQMLETFEKDIAAAQKEENKNQKEFEELKAAKEAEIAAGQAQIDKKTEELAVTDEKNAEAKQDIEDTKESLAADEKFLMMLKEKCSMTDKEWEERQKTRQLEMEAVSKAMAVLTSDDAHDVFTRTFNPAFVQKESRTHSERRVQASKLLSQVAAKTHNPRLVALAYQVKLDAFTRVKKAIDDMVAALLKEKEDEIKLKDFCTEELNTNELQTDDAKRLKEDLLAKIKDLEATIEELAKAIKHLKEQIVDMEAQLKKAGEERDKANAEYQETVADQQETQKLLKAALAVLQDFYGKKAKAALLQKQEPAGPPPPPGFEDYKKSAASGGVMAEIEKIINDARELEGDARRAEEEQQAAYEEFVTDTNAAIEAKQKDIANKSEAKAQAESDLVEAKKDLEENALELERLANYAIEMHQKCDFVLKNFDLRQGARDEEIEALRQAKAILSGAKFEAFLQQQTDANY